jgi:hypothetical protein
MHKNEIYRKLNKAYLLMHDQKTSEREHFYWMCVGICRSQDRMIGIYRSQGLH